MKSFIAVSKTNSNGSLINCLIVRYLVRGNCFICWKLLQAFSNKNRYTLFGENIHHF